jgi:uncharacterized protein DUF4124
MPEDEHPGAVAGPPLVESRASRRGARPERRAGRIAKVSFLLAWAVFPLMGAAAVYRCKGADGSVVFADSPCGPDAQVQVVRTPPVSDASVRPAGVGASGARGVVEARRQRNESSACWLAKYDEWQRSQPKSVTGSSTVARAKMVEFENECHWTPRTHVAAPLPPLEMHAGRPAVSEQGTTVVPASPLRADSLDAYLSDARLLASRQAATPTATIGYSDPASGALLKAVLDPARVTVMVDQAAHAADTRRFDELKRLLEPVQKRYAVAFNRDPRLYEPEYLDTLDINARLLRSSASLLQSSRAASTRPASPSAPDARLDQAAASLAQGMSGLMTTVAHMMAKEIRQQVATGRFSPAGARRASGIADSLMAAS